MKRSRLHFITLIMATTLFASCISTKKIYRKEVKSRFEKSIEASRTVTLADLNALPFPVAKYLENCGWLGKEIPQNFYFKFSGEFSQKRGRYMKVKGNQYSWMDEPTRLFLMNNWLISGRHRMDKRGAFMLIKLFNRIKVVDASGSIMDQSELVTYLNDLCILAPGALIEAPIVWEPINNYEVKATINEFGNTISATLFFNEQYELVNFISYDRYASNDGEKAEKLPWSTPIHSYVEVDGIKRPSYGEVIWHYPDYEFVYIKFKVEEIKYNLKKQCSN